MRGIFGELLWGALFVIIILGGVGMALYNTDIPLQPATPNPTNAAAAVTTLAPPAQQVNCSGGGCTLDPGTSCGQAVIRAVVQGRQKLYYTADAVDYAKHVTLHPEQGDRWFCTITNAEANGFKPAP